LSMDSGFWNISCTLEKLGQVQQDIPK